MTNHVLKHDNKALQNIMAKLDELQEFNTLFRQHIEPHFASHCQVVKYDKNCLIVLVENGNWATQLRFHIPHIMVKLRQYPLLKDLSGICCKTRPAFSKPSRKHKTHSVARLSKNTANVILETAKTIQDSRLRHILEKIAHN